MMDACEETLNITFMNNRYRKPKGQSGMDYPGIHATLDTRHRLEDKTKQNTDN
jgi:hypothetical protein